MCGLAPSRVLGALRYGAGGWESVAVRVLPTGKVEVVSGSTPHGQGHDTAWSQIVADQLGVPFEDITVLHGDTRISVKGMDTYGSRSLAVGGIAMVMACGKVRDKAKWSPRTCSSARADDLEFTDGAFRVRGNPEAAKTIAEIAGAVFAAHDLPDGMEPTLDSEATYDPTNFSFPHGTHLCAVEVDTETGRVKIRKYVAVDDVGKVINPMIVEGQVHGGVAQGIAQALFEEAVYDESGNLHHRLVRRVPAAQRGRPADDRQPTGPRPRRPGTRSASRASARRARSRPRRPWSTRSSTRCARAASTTYRCRCTPERVWRAAQRRCRMIPVAFDYVRPSTVEEAVAALAAAGEDGKVLAGGQSLLPVAAAAPGRTDDRGRPRRRRRDARHPGRRRRPRRRGDDHPRRGRRVRPGPGARRRWSRP